MTDHINKPSTSSSSILATVFFLLLFPSMLVEGLPDRKIQPDHSDSWKNSYATPLKKIRRLLVSTLKSKKTRQKGHHASVGLLFIQAETCPLFFFFQGVLSSFPQWGLHYFGFQPGETNDSGNYLKTENKSWLILGWRQWSDPENGLPDSTGGRD